MVHPMLALVELAGVLRLMEVAAAVMGRESGSMQVLFYPDPLAYFLLAPGKRLFSCTYGAAS